MRRTAPSHPSGQSSSGQDLASRSHPQDLQSKTRDPPVRVRLQLKRIGSKDTHRQSPVCPRSGTETNPSRARARRRAARADSPHPTEPRTAGSARRSSPGWAFVGGTACARQRRPSRTLTGACRRQRAGVRGSRRSVFEEERELGIRPWKGWALGPLERGRRRGSGWRTSAQLVERPLRSSRTAESRTGGRLRTR